MRSPTRIAITLIVVAAVPVPADAQWCVDNRVGCTSRGASARTAPMSVPAAEAASTDRSAWRPLSVAKWATLTAAAGSGTYGLWAQHEADRGYERVARICSERPDRCGGDAPVAASAEYADPAVGRIHDRAATLEDRALLSLIGSQIGLIASVLLFIFDMRDSGTPPNEIYQPPAVRVRPRGREAPPLGGRGRERAVDGPRRPGPAHATLSRTSAPARRSARAAARRTAGAPAGAAPDPAR